MDKKETKQREITEIPQRHIEEIRRYEHKIGADLGRSSSLILHDEKFMRLSEPGGTGLDGDVRTI